jgi:hypothetical protein
MSDVNESPAALSVFAASLASLLAESAPAFTESALLLQATITEAIAIIAKNFFIVFCFFGFLFKNFSRKGSRNGEITKCLREYFRHNRSNIVTVIYCEKTTLPVRR